MATSHQHAKTKEKIDFLLKEFEQIRARLRRSALFLVLRDTLITFAVWALISFLLDYHASFNLDQRIVFAVVGGAVIICSVVWRHRSLWQIPLNDESIAKYLEHIYPDRYQGLCSALQMPEGKMGQLALSTIVQKIPTIKPKDVLNTRVLRQRQIAVVLLILTFFATHIMFPGIVDVWFERNILFSNVAWPRDTHLHVMGMDNGKVLAIKGEPLTITTHASGVIPTHINYSFDNNAMDQSVQRVPINKHTQSGSFELPIVNRELSVRVTGGDGDTGWVNIMPQTRPLIESLSANLEFPLYTKEKKIKVNLSKSVVQVLENARVIIRGKSSQNIKSVSLTLNDKNINSMADGDIFMSREIVVKKPLRGWIELNNEHGISSRKIYINISPKHDIPPRVDIGSNSSRQITPHAKLEVKFQAIDDFGLQYGKLKYWSSNTGDEIKHATVLWNQKVKDGIAKKINHLQPVSLDSLNAKPGQLISIQGFAKDFAPATRRSREGKSAVLQFFVISESEMSDVLGAQAKEILKQLESIARSQEKITETIEQNRLTDQEKSAIQYKQDSIREQLTNVQKEMKQQESQWNQNFQKNKNLYPWPEDTRQKLDQDVIPKIQNVSKSLSQDNKKSASESSRQAENEISKLAKTIKQQLSRQEGMAKFESLIEAHEEISILSEEYFKIKFKQWGSEHQVKLDEFKHQWLEVMEWLITAEPIPFEDKGFSLDLKLVLEVIENSLHPESLNKLEQGIKHGRWPDVIRKHMIIRQQLSLIKRILTQEKVGAKDWFVKYLKDTASIQKMAMDTPIDKTAILSNLQSQVGQRVSDIIPMILIPKTRQMIAALVQPIPSLSKYIESKIDTVPLEKEHIRVKQQKIYDQILDLIAASETENNDSNKNENMEQTPAPDKQKKPSAPRAPLSKLKFLVLRQTRLIQNTRQAVPDQAESLLLEQRRIGELFDSMIGSEGEK